MDAERCDEDVPAAEPGSLESLGIRWRTALDAAESALAAAAPLPASERARRRARLAVERADALRLLRALARDEGLSDRFVHLTPRRFEKQLLGLPSQVKACVFNLEGVLVASVRLHVAAWQQAFDEFGVARTERTGVHVAPFDPRNEYRRHIHGRPRVEGVRALLGSRGISLPEGSPDDAPGAETIHGLANRKNELLRRRIDRLGVKAYEGSWQYLETAREAGLHTAVVSASANTRRIVRLAGLADVVEGCVDGNAIVAEHLPGSPAPDRQLAACRILGVEPGEAASFQTSPVGIEAARAGRFAFVVGIERALPLAGADADLVVPDLAELLDRRLAA